MFSFSRSRGFINQFLEFILGFRKLWKADCLISGLMIFLHVHIQNDKGFRGVYQFAAHMEQGDLTILLIDQLIFEKLHIHHLLYPLMAVSDVFQIYS